MKQIFPTSSKQIEKIEQEQRKYEDLVARLNTAVEELNNSSADLEDYKAEVDSIIRRFLESFTTDSLTANKAIIEELEAKIAKADSLEAINSTITSLRADSVNSSSIVTDNLNSSDIKAERIEADEVVTDNLQLDSLTTVAITADDATIRTLNSTEADITEATISDATISQAEIDNASISDAEINNASITEATIEDASITKQDVNYITHKLDPQEVDEVADSGDYWIVFPTFTDGHYYLEARNDTDAKLWSFEVWNSLDNFQFRWSTLKQYLIDVEMKTDENGLGHIQVHANSLNEHATLYRLSESTDNTLPPTIYDHRYFEGSKKFSIDRSHGTYLSNSTFAGEFHAESMLIDDVIFDNITVNHSVTVPNGYDEYGAPEGYTTGEPGQYLTKGESITLPNGEEKETLRWQEPEDRDTSHSNGNERVLVTEQDVSTYNGKREYLDDNDDTVEEYNIVHLGNGAITHGSHIVNETLLVKEDAHIQGSLDVDSQRTDENLNIIHNHVKFPNIYNGPDTPTMPDNSLVIETERTDDEGNPIAPVIERKTTESVAGVLKPRYDEIAAYDKDVSATDMDKKPMAYNEEHNAIYPTDELDIGNLDVDRLKAERAEIGELFVTGTSHIVDEETVSTTGDTIVLRQNATTGLTAGQISGIVINNYKVDDEGNATDLSLVTDSDGTLRVGTGSGTSTSYSKIAWNESEKKWYSYDDTDPDNIEYALLETQPTGTITDFQGKTEKDPYTLYSSVTFTVIDKTTLQPLLTRDEDANINDQAILKYNKSESRAEGLPLPTINGQVLKASITEDEEGNTNYSYGWSGTDTAGIFRFEDEDAYKEALEIEEGEEGYIPDGSIILIDGDYNVVMEAE